jgi:hypothetical protein
MRIGRPVKSSQRSSGAASPATSIQVMPPASPLAPGSRMPLALDPGSGRVEVRRRVDHVIDPHHAA